MTQVSYTQEYKEFVLKYHPKWIEDCITSAEYLQSKGELDKAYGYIQRGFLYLESLKKAQSE